MQKITVIIPNYNHGKYLPECLDALLSQSQKADEIIVIDDGSSDNSIEVIRSYQAKAPEIILLRNEQNKGVHYSFNKAIKQAKNQIIGGFAADDFILPGFFEKAMKLFNQYSDLALVCADNTLFYDQQPYKFISNTVHICDTPTVFQPKEFIELLRKTNFYIASNICLIKKDILLKYCGYDPNLLSLTDFYLSAQIAFRHSIAYIPEALGAYRLMSSSYGSSIRFNWKKRIKLLDYLMYLIFKKEDKQFKKAFIRSGLLSFNGYFMVLYLIMRPLYWRFFPFIFYKVLKRKFAKY